MNFIMVLYGIAIGFEKTALCRFLRWVEHTFTGKIPVEDGGSGSFPSLSFARPTDSKKVSKGTVWTKCVAENDNCSDQ